MIQIKPTATLLFAVLLTGWVHFTSSEPPFYRQYEYDLFLRRLGQAISASSPGALPLWLNGSVIPNLMGTSDEFKELCLQYDAEKSLYPAYTPIMALYETINYIFCHYTRSTTIDNSLIEVLEEMKSTDPIGFIVGLKNNNVPKIRASLKFRKFIHDCQTTMHQRMRLLNMKTNDSLFDIFDGSSSSTPHNFFPSIRIPAVVRNEIATEYGPLSDVSINSFTDLFERMCRVGIGILDEYPEHFSPKLSDVQILYDIPSPETFHAICIFFQPISYTIHVYDSLWREEVNEWQDAVIQKLYPYNRGILFKKPKTRQNPQHPTGAIFAIMYASMLLLGDDVTRTRIKLNTVCGDETLYMRIHILNMVASRRLSALE